MSKQNLSLRVAGAVVAAVSIFAAGIVVGESSTDAMLKPVIAQALPNVPGKTLTAVLVTYPPGGASDSHKHAGSVFAYVVSGKIRSEVSTTGPARVYSAGEGFF